MGSVTGLPVRQGEQVSGSLVKTRTELLYVRRNGIGILAGIGIMCQRARIAPPDWNSTPSITAGQTSFPASQVEIRDRRP
jgi:hypothetical protein